MSERVPVVVAARDPISRAGIAAQLRGRPEVRVVDDDDASQRVAVVVTDEMDADAATMIRCSCREGSTRVVLVVTQLDDKALLAGIEAGACGVLRRSEASAEALSSAVSAASSGDGSVPADLLGRLLEQVGRLQRNVLGPRGLTLSGLNPREAAVLRLVADGLDTAEVADELSYSERTVKNVIHDITSRFQLRNRSHAVAYAVREGLI